MTTTVATPLGRDGDHGPHSVRKWLTLGTALVAGCTGLFSGSLWPSRSPSAAVPLSVLEMLLSILVLRWPRAAGITLLVVAPFQILAHSGPPVVWRDLLAGAFAFAAGVLAESARRPDGHCFYVARVMTEIVIVSLVSAAAIVIAIVAVAISVLGQ
jgi:hypothetical protein